MTSFYSWRLIFLTFYGEPRWAASEHVQHAGPTGGDVQLGHHQPAAGHGRPHGQEPLVAKHRHGVG